MRAILRMLVSALVAFSCLSAMAAPYTAGTILPSAPAAERDAALLDFYRQWKEVYFQHGCGDGRAFVDVAADGKPVYGGTEAQSITVSEAHGYGMLALVMMAAYDTEARSDFDRMVRFFHDHPAQSSAGLMAWNQVEGCADAGADVGGSNSATDGDLDIAYALLLADRIWGSTGEIDYRAKARSVIDAIMTYDVAPKGKHLLIGDWVGNPDDLSYAQTTRSSDWMVSHLRSFADLEEGGDWSAVADRTYAIIDAIRDPQTGLVPDFIIDLDTVPQPAPTMFLEGEHDGDYAWNACRYPWRLALDYLLHGEVRAREATASLNRWIVAATSGSPHAIANGYELDGTPMDEGRGSMAFVAPFGVSAMVDSRNQAWLDAVWADVVAREIGDEDYYGNTIKLLSMIVMSGHWPTP